MEDLDILSHGALSLLLLRACCRLLATVVDHDWWVWLCAADAAGNLIAAARDRAARRDHLSEASGAASLALLFAYRAPVMEWMRNPVVPQIQPQLAFAALGTYWFVGMTFITALVIALFGSRQKTREGE